MMLRSLGETVSDARRRKGLSQKDLAALIDRSESWVSQVERDVLPVERLALLQKLAQVLDIGLHDLRPEAIPQETYSTPIHADLELLRSAITGHPALEVLFNKTDVKPDYAQLETEAHQAWQTAVAHSSDFALLAAVIPKLEAAARTVKPSKRRDYEKLLARSYQAASAGFAYHAETDAAWVAADRALTAAEASGDPYQILASHFRLAHSFIRLNRFDQADLLATNGIEALKPADGEQPELPALSLQGALLLVQAVVAGLQSDRTPAREALDAAEKIARQLPPDQNDYDTEFNLTNVQLHRVAIATDLGDAGEAIDIAKTINADHLSHERQMRLQLDLARAHTQRRHIDKATQALLTAERLAPEHLHAHHLAHQTVTELLALSVRPTDDLTGLAKRLAITPSQTSDRPSQPGTSHE